MTLTLYRAWNATAQSAHVKWEHVTGSVGPQVWTRCGRRPSGWWSWAWTLAIRLQAITSKWSRPASTSSMRRWRISPHGRSRAVYLFALSPKLHNGRELCFKLSYSNNFGAILFNVIVFLFSNRHIIRCIHERKYVEENLIPLSITVDIIVMST